MIDLIENHRSALGDLCRKYRVKSLEVFGSAVGDDVMQVKRTKRGKPDAAILADIVKRIVRAARPERIIMFGSAARGEMGPNSDIDLLVVKAGKFDHLRVTVAIHRALRGKGAPVDVVVVTPEEVERYRDAHCLVIATALSEGRLIYASKKVPT
jgi:predicted nucleotidyltransferase